METWLRLTVLRPAQIHVTSRQYIQFQEKNKKKHAVLGCSDVDTNTVGRNTGGRFPNNESFTVLGSMIGN